MNRLAIVFGFAFAAFTSVAPAAVEAGEITAEAKAAKGVEKRMPVGEASTFTKGEEVWVWTLVKGAAAGDVVKHVWKKDGAEDWTRDLKIGGARWSTNSRRKVKPGQWTVEVQTADGQKLTEVAFTVE